MTSFGEKFAKIPVTLAESRWSNQPSRNSLILFLNLLPLAKVRAQIPLRDFPNHYLSWTEPSKILTESRQFIRENIAELSNLQLEVESTWQNVFNRLELRDDVLTIEPSQYLSSLLQEKTRYGYCSLNLVDELTSATAIRFACFLAPYLQRWQQRLVIPLEKLRMVLGLEGKYLRYTNLKTKVLDRIVGEYNLYNEKKTIRFDEIRRGRGGSVEEIIIYLDERANKPPPSTGLPLPDRSFLEKESSFNPEEERKYLEEAQRIHGLVIPHFSVRATLEALDTLGGDIELLERMITNGYHPKLHAIVKRDGWLTASARIWANMLEASDPNRGVESAEVEAMFEEMLKKRRTD